LHDRFHVDNFVCVEFSAKANEWHDLGDWTSFRTYVNLGYRRLLLMTCQLFGWYLLFLYLVFLYLVLLNFWA